MNLGMFFGSLIIVYLVSYFFGHDRGFKDAKEIMKKMERLRKFESEDEECDT